MFSPLEQSPNPAPAPKPTAVPSPQSGSAWHAGPPVAPASVLAPAPAPIMDPPNAATSGWLAPYTDTAPASGPSTTPPWPDIPPGRLGRLSKKAENETYYFRRFAYQVSCLLRESPWTRTLLVLIAALCLFLGSMLWDASSVAALAHGLGVPVPRPLEWMATTLLGRIIVGVVAALPIAGIGLAWRGLGRRRHRRSP